MNLNEKLDKYIINEHADVLELLERQEKYKLKTFFIITDDKKILGTVSDGDFRRYVLKNKKAPIRSF